MRVPFTIYFLAKILIGIFINDESQKQLSFDKRHELCIRKSTRGEEKTCLDILFRKTVIFSQDIVHRSAMR